MLEAVFFHADHEIGITGQEDDADGLSAARSKTRRQLNLVLSGLRVPGFLRLPRLFALPFAFGR